MNRILEEQEACLTELLRRPKYPDRQFSCGCSYDQLYGMADWLREQCCGHAGRQTLCLATENKAVIAAALLASLGGGPTLLLPYAFSGRVLEAIRQATGYSAVIAESGRELPSGPERIVPEMADYRGDAGTMAAPVLNKELLRLCTGGTTGVPQLWSKTAANIFFEALHLASWLGIDENDYIIATVPPYHIYGLLYSVVLPLVASARVLDAAPSYPGEIIEAVRQKQGTVLISVPAHYASLRGKAIGATSLRLAISSAGMLPQADNENFTGRNTIDLIEIYGSTETGGIASRNRFRGESAFTPFPAVQWQCTERRLLVRSPYLSPELAVDSEGFFMCGDEIEPCGAGSFALRGRADHIAKVGGKRVNLEEIDTLIRRQQGVLDCAVAALPETGSRQCRIGALVQGEVDVESLRLALAAGLEPYSQPRLIKIVDRIPVLKNGKYDRQEIERLLMI